MIKKITLIFLILILCACQNRIGTIKLLDNLKQSDISGIKLTYINKEVNDCYLTENDETTIIKSLAKFDLNKLEKTNKDFSDFDYLIIIETTSNTYQMSLSKTLNIISINEQVYLIDDNQKSILNDMLDCLNNISY